MSKPAHCMCGDHTDRPATHQIAIDIWALATAPDRRTQKNCIRMLFGVVICSECRERVKAADFLLPEGRARIASGMHRAGAAMPDFSSAKIAFVEIIDQPIDPEQVIRDAARRGDRTWEA